MMLVSTLACYAMSAWVLSWVARKAGSERAKFRFALLAVILVSVLSALYLVAMAVLPHGSAVRLPTILGLLVIELVAPFFIFKRIFRVKAKHAFILYLVFVGVIAIQSIFATCVLKRYLAEAFRTPSPTMSPTIEPSDRFLANKLLHPRRWDVVVYWNHSESDGPPQPFCKRLIGLPGERLRFENGNLYVNDQLTQPPPVLAGKLHASADGFKGGPWKFADGETISLGPDEFFFVGDNIAISADSRVNGPSDRTALIGVVDAIYWPLGRFRVLR